MRDVELNTGEMLKRAEEEIVKERGGNVPQERTRSMQSKENTTTETAQQRLPSRTFGGSSGGLIRVSEAQFMTIREESLESLRLLNCSGNVLLSAMETLVPPPESGRTIGDYTGENMRRIAKSVCDIINTKCNVVRQMHSIARDE